MRNNNLVFVSVFVVPQERMKDTLPTCAWRGLDCRYGVVASGHWIGATGEVMARRSKGLLSN